MSVADLGRETRAPKSSSASMSAETSLEPCAAGRVGPITACPAVGAPHKPPRVMRRSEQALYRWAGDSWAGRTRARHGAPRMPGDGERTHLAGSFLVSRSIVICGVHALGQSARGRLCGASPPPPAAACPDEQQLAAHERRQEFDSLMAENKKLKQAARCSAHGAAGLPRFHKVRCPARHRSTMTCFCAALCPEIFASSSGKQAGRSFLNFSAALSAQFPAKGQQKRRKHT